MERRIRTYAELGGEDASGVGAQVRAALAAVARRLEDVEAVVGVMSGKGGVGKSFVAAGLAEAAAAAGLHAGLLDADLEGPSAPGMAALERSPTVTDGGVRPGRTAGGTALMSMALLLGDAAARWSGPAGESFAGRAGRERGALREFLADVEWGALDLLVVDLPPGTGRLHDLADLLPAPAPLVAVTIPTAASGASVGRALETAVRRGLPIVGVVENMAGVASGTGGRDPLFPGAAGAELADRFGVPLLGRLPFDPGAAALAEEGRMAELLEETEAGAGLRTLAGRVTGHLGLGEAG